MLAGSVSPSLLEIWCFPVVRDPGGCQSSGHEIRGAHRGSGLTCFTGVSLSYGLRIEIIIIDIARRKSGPGFRAGQ